MSMTKPAGGNAGQLPTSLSHTLMLTKGIELPPPCGWSVNYTIGAFSATWDKVQPYMEVD